VTRPTPSQATDTGFLSCIMNFYSKNRERILFVLFFLCNYNHVDNLFLAKVFCTLHKRMKLKTNQEEYRRNSFHVEDKNSYKRNLYRRCGLLLLYTLCSILVYYLIV